MLRIITGLLIAICIAGCGGGPGEEELLERARAALEAGDASAAIVDAKAALQKNRESPLGRYLLGRAYLARLDPAAAADELERALQAGPSAEIRGWYAQALVAAGRGGELLAMPAPADESWNPRGRAARARAQLQAGEAEAARQTLEALPADAGESAYVATTRLLVDFQVDSDPAAAADAARAVLEVHPEAVDTQVLLAGFLQAQQDIDGALAVLADIARTHPERLQQRLQLVQLYTDSGDVESADEALRRLEQQIPDHPGVRFARGRLQMRDGDYAAALQSLAVPLGANPRHLPSLYLSGLANVEQGNFATARRQLRQFLEMGDGNPVARLQLARAELGLDNAVAAEAAAREILEEDPMNSKALGVLALALAAQGAAPDSAAAYEQLATLEPESVEARLGASAQRLAAGDVDAAIDNLRAALDIQPQNDSIRQRLILTLARAGRVDDAREAAGAYRELRAGTTEPLVTAAAVEMLARDFDAAGRYYDSALAIEPRHVGARKGLAMLEVMAGRIDAGISAFEEVLQDAPGDLEVLTNLAGLAERRSDMDAMAGYLRRAIDSNPQALAPRRALASYAMRREQYSEVIELIEPVLDPDSSPGELWRLVAAAYSAVGRGSDAISAGSRALAQSPEDTALLLLLAREEQRRANLGAARSYLERAIALAPDNLSLKRQRLALLVEQGDTEGAAQALADLPEDMQAEPALLNLGGRIAVAQQRFDDAEQLFTRALEKQPAAENLLAVVGLQWRDGRREEALALTRDWLAENGDSGPVRRDLAQRLMLMGDEPAAIEQYRLLLEAQPESVAALNNLAWLQRERDPQAARVYAERALAAAPGDANVLDTLAMVLLAQGDSGQALLRIDEALEAAPDSRGMRFNKARILASAGRRDEALRLLDGLLEEPEFPGRDEVLALRDELL